MNDNHNLPDAARQELLAGKKISAIKIVRAEEGIGLKEAKEKVEKYLNSDPGLKSIYESKTVNGGNCFGILIFCIIIAWYLASNF